MPRTAVKREAYVSRANVYFFTYCQTGLIFCMCFVIFRAGAGFSGARGVVWSGSARSAAGDV